MFMPADGTVVDIGRASCPTCPSKCLDINVSGGEVITSLTMGVAAGWDPNGSYVDSFKIKTLNPQGGIQNLRSDYDTRGRPSSSNAGQEFSVDGEREKSETQLSRVYMFLVLNNHDFHLFTLAVGSGLLCGFYVYSSTRIHGLAPVFLRPVSAEYIFTLCKFVGHCFIIVQPCSE